MTEVALLGRRAVREIARYPEATIPTLFIALFFRIVNIGQVSKTFPSSTPFLNGQGYVAFQLPVSLMFAVATATSGLALGGIAGALLIVRRAAHPQRQAAQSSFLLFFPLLFLTPNFVPFDRLSPAMETLARITR